MRYRFASVLVTAAFALAVRNGVADDAPPTATAVASAADKLLEAEFRRTDTTVAPRTRDEDFLRRVTFDLAGTAPTPSQVTLFGLDPNPAKRAAVVERLLASDGYARNWAGYWRDVVVSRATNERVFFARGAFDEWLTEQFRSNTPWDELARSLVTASGDVRENGATGLIFAHEGAADEVASEVSRVFLGIQIQCANCHDHPSDVWKREQFHELAAFFPRVAVRPVREGDQLRSYEVVSTNPRTGRGTPFGTDPARTFRFLDRDGDGKLTKTEAARTPFGQNFERLLERLDGDKDGALTAQEFAAFTPPTQPGRGSDEHYMPNLENPASRGTAMQPVFFVNEQKLKAGASDADRRQALADWLTAEDNPWFARAVVNRLWSELLGAGFYTPVDDIGPERSARHPEVLDLLCRGFVANGHDLKWLFRAITATEAYQRQVRADQLSETVAPFAAAKPTRLRSDQIYSAISQVFGITEPNGGTGGLYQQRRSPRDGFNTLFAFDPSTPHDEVTGDVPQALFLMNSPQVGGLVRADGRSRLSRILAEFEDDSDAVAELYLLVLSREPSAKELQVCRDYVREVGNRNEAFEDLLWSLLNSSEFLTKR